MVMTNVMLLNLLIARMTSSYERVNLRAFEEWSFMKAKIVEQYLLLKEHHVLYILPPPLNIFTTLLYPFHRYYLPFGISIAGTYSNFVLSLFIGGWLRLITYFMFTSNKLRLGSKTILQGRLRRNIQAVLTTCSVTIPFLFFFFTFYHFRDHIIQRVNPRLDGGGNAMLYWKYIQKDNKNEGNNQTRNTTR
jgi:hypothetical protein